jgi:amino acid adenylation domain-containing protein
VVAAIKAGAAYVPLDPAYPRERLEYLLRDCGAQVLVTDPSLAAGLPEHGGEVLFVGEEQRHLAAASRSEGAPRTMPEHPAYVIYTSGSTGTPKGVLVSHWNVLRLFEATREGFQFGAEDVWTLFHSYAFDFSVWEIWGALLHGGRLVVVPYWVSRSPEAFHDLLRRESVTVLNQTPSAFYQLAQVEQGRGEADRLSSLRYVIFGGEGLEPQKLAPWFARYGDRSPALVNMYGITETTVHVTFRPLSQKDLTAAGSPIGVPIPDLRIYLLDPVGQPVPPGLRGEIHVGGDGVAQGYHGRPALTAERFVPDPFSGTAGARLYRSGDLARRQPGGELVYLGRADRQVKIRGFRIELGEIEANLSAHPGLADAAVVVRETADGPPQLIAYVVPAVDEPMPSIDELREFLAQRIPAYMVPARFLSLPVLPLTPHGKLDRRALPEVTGERSEMEEAWVAPRNPVEEILAAVWAQVLGADRVGIHDNFFALGGDSIRSLQVLAAARDRGVRLTLLQLFQHQTIATLSRELSLTEESPLPDLGCEPFSLISDEDRARLPGDIEDAYPLAALQEGMLYHMALQPDDAPYHNVDSWLVAAQLEPDLLRRAVQEVVRRHPLMRTSFDLDSYSQPLQLVHRDAVLPVGVEDLRHLPAADQEKHIAAFLAGQKRQLFDFTVAPQLRFHVHRLTADTFRFTLIENHAVFDGWSLHATLAEIFSRYFGLLKGTALPEVPPPTLTYRDFVYLERATIESAAAREHWRRQLHGSSATELPKWEPDPLTPGPRHHEVEVPISAETSAGLQRLARITAVPIKSVLLAAHLRVLGLVSGQRDVTTGVVFNGRPEQPGGEEVRGLFLNSLPLRMRLPGGSWTDLVREAFAAELTALPFRRFPLGVLQREAGGRDLFEVLFNFINFHVVESLLESGDIEVREFQGFEGTSYPLHVTLSPRVRLTLEYDSTVLPRAEVEWIGGYFSRAFEAMSTDPAGSYDSLVLLDPMERHQLESLGATAGAAVPASEPFSLLSALSARDKARLPEDLEDAYPLTLLQAGVLSSLALSPEDPPYLKVDSFRLRMRFSETILREAARRVVARHPVLRTSFDLGASEPIQRVHRQAAVPLAVEDLSGRSASQQEEAISRQLAAEKRRLFDLAEAPQLRFHVFVLGPEEIQLTLTHSHAILDGWSLGATLAELFTLYCALLRGEDPPAAPPLALAYRDFVTLELRTLASPGAEAFWDEVLDGAPFTALSPWPAWPLSQEAPWKRSVDLPLSSMEVEGLQTLARQARVPLKNVLLAAYLKTLAVAVRESEVVTGLAANGRLEVADGDEVRGLFRNILPLRLALQRGSWLDLIQAAARAETAMLPHRRYPLPALQRRRPDQPLVEATFDFVDFHPGRSLALVGEVAVTGYRKAGGDSFKLAVSFTRQLTGDGLSCELEYDAWVLPRRQVEAFGETLARVLATMAAAPAAEHEALPLLTAPERQQLLVEWNDTAAAAFDAGRLSPTAERVHELFEWQAARRPDALAVAGQGTVLRYGELEMRSNRLARWLRRLGVGPEVRVGLCVERTPEMVVALLAILKAGGAYVPLDPAHPVARLALVLDDSAPAVLVTEERWLDRLAAAAGDAGSRVEPRVVCLDLAAQEIAAEGASPLRAAAPPESLAYVIYTSGSSGRPKGVGLPHRAVVAFLRAMAVRPGLGPDDVVPALTTLTFDIAGLEIYLPLAVGGRVEVVDREESVDGYRLAERLATAGVTVMQATPAGWRLLVDSGWQGQPGLKGLCGGEALPRELAAALLARGVELWNVYGPTETAVWSTTGPVADTAISLGRPITNTRLYVLDSRLKPPATGLPGELLIGGAGVARGYWLRPELTAERFVPDPWAAAPGERLYRTGDLVRWRWDGEIEFLGRIDHQVKVRGHRIEPGEIEALLARYPGVREAVVVVRQETGDPQLVAYVVPSPGQPVAPDELRRYVQDNLPPYMVPATFVELEALPRTANGKLDRRALPLPGKSLQKREITPPRSPLQLQLVQLWEEILSLRPIGIRDDFFELGGNSLVGVRLVAQIRKQLGRTLALSALATVRTVEELAALLEQEAAGPKRHLVPLQPRGSKPPIYLMHPGHGNVLCYLDLARYLGTDQPLYGLQALDWEDNVNPFADIEEMASRYVAEIREHQPEGTYLIGGWSLGGVIAFEVAQQLTRAGEEVAGLFLLDCMLPVIASGLLAISPSLMRSYLLIDHVREAAAAAGKEPPPLTPYDIDGLPMDEQLDLLVGELEKRDALPLGVDKDMLRRYFAIRLTRIEAQNRYVPKPYPGHITLIRTTDLNLGITLHEMRKMYRDAMVNHPTYGWSEFTPEPVEVRHMPGHHESMVREPHVQALAEELRACITEIEARLRQRALATTETA